MAEAVKPRRRRRAEDPVQEEKRQLREGIAQTQALLNQAYAGFNSHIDPDLVDSCVYEINSLQSRYSYLVRRMKELEPEGRAGA